jgi:hypothetical protein
MDIMIIQGILENAKYYKSEVLGLKKMKIFVKMDNLSNNRKISKIYAAGQFSKEKIILRSAE